MILHLTVLLVFQLIGELIAQGFDLALPGPVIGMALLFFTCLIRPDLAERITPTAQVLLAHLSLLFVPAGVGVVGHFSTFAENGPALAIAILGSTAISLVAGVLTFVGLAKWRGTS